MEGHGIKVDLKPAINGTMTSGMTSYMAHLQDKEDGGFVKAGFHPQRSKTGRVQVAKGSFKCMNIPKTSVRRSIVSRFDDGKIAILDFNAADYRCIVAAVGDTDLSRQYEGVDDFHTKTAEAIFGDDARFRDVRRKVVKSTTYMSLYGGSVKNVAKATGLAPSVIDLLLGKMSFMEPIHRFRDELHRTSIKQGYVTTPTGMRIPLDGSEHPGKVLALYAQTCTNDAFMDGLVNVHDFLTDKKSRVLFTVHDELVIDVAPSEEQYLGNIKDTMELGSAKLFGMRLKVKLSTGINYWDQNND
jgi:DNA polymerase-1